MTATPQPLDQTPASTLSALRTLGLERAGIAALEAALLEPASSLASRFDAAVALITRATGRVIVTGMGKSGHVGRKIAATLASTGTPAYFVHPGEASHGDLGMIQSGDAILALSWSGETAELADIITYSRRYGIALVALTSNPESALGREADVCLDLPKSEEACPNGLAPTTSTTMQLVMGDALAVALLEARGFTAQDFRQFHPGGKLGANLSFVRDIMHKDEAIPLVPVGARMEHALIEMTGKRFGCVGVIDDAGLLVGIITDGDLRRRMKVSHDLLAEPVELVMTPRPMTIGPDTMAAEALALLNETKRSVVLVVDDRLKPVGIIHLHDLYRVGVA
jgi:arabinose-5-phosphate isomerase